MHENVRAVTRSVASLLRDKEKEMKIAGCKLNTYVKIAA